MSFNSANTAILDDVYESVLSGDLSHITFVYMKKIAVYDGVTLCQFLLLQEQS